jgi:CubicO group peptidase (beta-lactamase class C family)
MALVGAVLGTRGGSAVAQPRRSHDWSSVEAIVTKAVAERITPGLQLCVWRGGRPIYSRALGSANLEVAAPLTPASVMRIGSITKQFTAAAVLLLQEDGRLSVDDPLSRFVPEIEAGKQVSLRQMLTHVSGLAISPSDGPAARRGLEIIEHDTASMVAAIQSLKPELRTPPGAQWVYNNLAYRLLGVVAERASGMRLRALFKARLFDPARLERTAVEDMGEVLPGRAAGYTPAPGEGQRFRNAPPNSLSWSGGAGNMRSTTEDLCRWHDVLLGGRLLRPESLKAMLTPVRLSDGSLPPARAELAGSEPLRYGFGVELRTEGGRFAVTHTGGNDGFVSQLTSYPESRVSVAGIINSHRAGKPQNASPNEQVLRAAVTEAARIALA